MYLNQKINLIKKNGKTFKGIKASVQKKIFIDNVMIPIEVGDSIEHYLPSGVRQEFVITDFVLLDQLSIGFGGYYEIEYKRKNGEDGSSEQGSPKQRVILFKKYDFHPKIKEVAYQLFQDGHFKEAIFNSFVEVIDHVKEKAGRPTGANSRVLDGDDLMNQTFGIERHDPIIKFNDLSDEADKDEQRGIMFLFKGIVGIRNKKGHLNFVQNDPLKTIEYLSLASLLMRLLDENENYE